MNQNAIKKCRICGDAASAFNYNGLTCEACKVFFRRNASCRETLVCRRDTNDCAIQDRYSRKGCSKCRLEKCFSIGMKYKTRSQHSVQNIQTLQTSFVQQQACTLQYKHKLLQTNTPAHFTEYEYELTKQMKNLINENFVEESQLKLVKPQTENDMQNLFNLPSNYARKIVKFCKQIEQFKSIKPEDQFAILKPFYFEFCTMRYAFTFDVKKDGFTVMLNESASQAVLFDFKMFDQLEDKSLGREARNINQKLGDELENDPIMRDLIIVQLLFTPRENITCQELIKYQYHVYSRLLRRYLELKYNNISKANQKYSALMKILGKLTVLKEILRKVYITFDQVDEVLAEVFEIT